MFSPEVYTQRRRALRERIQMPVLIPGNLQPLRNPSNLYPFRQSSHFLYFAGLSIPRMALVMTENEDILFGPVPSVSDMVWTGPLPSLEELGAKVGISRVEDINSLESFIKKLNNIKYIAPHLGETTIWLSSILGQDPASIKNGQDMDLVEAVCEMRLHKDSYEIAEIEKAIAYTRDMFEAARRSITPGKKEHDILAALKTSAADNAHAFSFNPIVTVHGEVLHNEVYHHTLEEGRLLLVDAGAEAPSGYAGDITRTYPVNGRFTDRQKVIYETVLRAQMTGIEMVRPGMSYKEVHLAAARVIIEGLREAGLMKGNTDSALEAGAHALFFPHGLGHMMGLDVHDMEDLGDIVGYGRSGKRSTQFGLNFLRLQRTLEPGYVLTVEPGIYFIPALFRQWQEEHRHEDFIVYDEVAKYLDFGGIRIEDDVLVTQDGHRVLGPPIPKTPQELEE